MEAYIFKVVLEQEENGRWAAVTRLTTLRACAAGLFQILQ
jgi:hypothetical protein